MDEYRYYLEKGEPIFAKCLLITSCYDPSLWYYNLVGTFVVYLPWQDDETLFGSKDSSDHVNFVLKRDATVARVLGLGIDYPRGYRGGVE